MPRPPRQPKQQGSTQQPANLTLRIVGGSHRGRKLNYNGDLATRPMKDRVREAVFNLVGPSIKGTHIFDLFAGTGAVAIESLSRGAVTATAVERRFDMMRLVQQNARELDLEDRLEVIAGNTFLWSRDIENIASKITQPWGVFCCPPYAFYQDRWPELETLLNEFIRLAPHDSFLLVEADQSFDFAKLPQMADQSGIDVEAWDVRSYPPAQIGLLRIVRTQPDA